jgi:hypothetical protein
VNLMLAFALTTAFLVVATNADSAATHQLAAPCSVLQAKATQYFSEHRFRTVAITDDTGPSVDLDITKDSSTPSGAPLLLSRSSIHRYTLREHLSPFKSYTNFRGAGHLHLTTVTAASCLATLHFDFSAFGYVWSLAVIDDGYRSTFVSNGSLERGYLEALVAVLTKSQKISE